MLQHWIWLTNRKGIGPRSVMALLRHFGDPEAVYFADPDHYKAVPDLGARDLSALEDKSLESAQKILEDCFNKNIKILTIQDAAYPDRLKNIPDPPAVLYYVGKLPEFDAEAAIAVVGTRKASAYGILTAKRLGYQIGRCGGLVVSGLAGGIDSAAMTGALTAGCPVVGVLGCGVDVVYPRYNGELYRDTAVRGCLISEFPPRTPPERQNFPRRNRVMAGLSLGVLVVEAPAKSGALITADQALEQGRDVFAVPGNIDSPNSEGTNRLISQGAMVAGCGWDVMKEYQALFPGKIARFEGGVKTTAEPELLRSLTPKKPVAMVASPRKTPKETKKSIDNPPQIAYIDLKDIEQQLTEDEKRILSALTKGPTHVDEVIAGTGLAASRVLASMTLLEVKGLIRRLPGKQYERSHK